MQPKLAIDLARTNRYGFGLSEDKTLRAVLSLAKPLDFRRHGRLELKTKQRILEAVREVLRDAGLPQPEEAAENKRAALTAGSIKKAAKATVSIFVVEMWEQLDAKLRDAPEPTSAELENDIRDVKDMIYLLRDQMLKKGKSLPHRPGGAPRKFTSKDEEHVCRIVGQLMGRGDTYSEAVAATALRFGVSTKTIQRTWQNHRKRKRNKAGSGASDS